MRRITKNALRIAAVCFALLFLAVFLYAFHRPDLVDFAYAYIVLVWLKQ